MRVTKHILRGPDLRGSWTAQHRLEKLPVGHSTRCISGLGDDPALGTQVRVFGSKPGSPGRQMLYLHSSATWWLQPLSCPGNFFTRLEKSACILLKLLLMEILMK